MGERIATVIIEPRSLVRDALVSLMEGHSYQVVCKVASPTDIDGGAFKGGPPKLVILGTLPVDRVAEATSAIHRRWPAAKIIMLSENVSSTDLQTLLASGLDACIPVFAPPRALIGALQLIASEQLRILMVSAAAVPGPSTDLRADDEGVSKLEGRQRMASFVPPLHASALGAAARGSSAHRLSEREDQILKALVQGHSNKVIARMCTVTEATVKVHVKSILRKVRVANRTQAAIWALENAYFADASGTRPDDTRPAPSDGYNQQQLGAHPRPSY